MKFKKSVLDMNGHDVYYASSIIETDAEGQVGRGNLQEWNNMHTVIL